jgi:hypothetical protein
MNLANVVEYVMSHDTGPAFRGKNFAGVTKAVLENKVAMVVNGDKIVGVMTVKVREGLLLEVLNLYTSHPKALAGLLDNLYNRFPFHSFTALRAVKNLPGKVRRVNYSWNQFLKIRGRL